MFSMTIETMETLKSPNPRNRNSISLIKSKFLSVSSMTTLLAILKVTNARRDVILAGGLYHRFPWRHLPPPSPRWNPYTPHLLTPWHLTFSHKKRFFRKWADWSIWKDAHRLFRRFSLVRYFAARSLFFVRRNWPRAWQLTVLSHYTMYVDNQPNVHHGSAFQNSEFFDWNRLEKKDESDLP